MALTAYFANNKALRIKLAPTAAGITECMGLWWELLLPTAARAHLAPAAAGLFPPALPPSLSYCCLT